MLNTDWREHGIQRQLRVLVALAGVLVSLPVYAQTGGAANIAGVIADDSGAALPGVAVTVLNTATGRAQTLVTSDEGRYRVVALQPGPYVAVSYTHLTLPTIYSV